MSNATMEVDGEMFHEMFHKRTVPSGLAKAPDGFIFVAVSIEEWQSLRLYEVAQAQEAARKELIVQKNGLDLISLAIGQQMSEPMDQELTPGSGGANSLYADQFSHVSMENNTSLSQVFSTRDGNMSSTSLSPLTTSLASTPTTELSPRSASRSRATSLDTQIPLSKSKSMEL